MARGGGGVFPMSTANVTKQMLADALKTLLQDLPFSKVSVLHICKLCGMNRKSFSLDPEQSGRIETTEIDGRKYLLVPVEGLRVNGLPVEM